MLCFLLPLSFRILFFLSFLFFIFFCPFVFLPSSHTVIEVNGRDFPGLLHRLTHTLADLGLQIQTATVSTYGERVVDVFYVKDLFGLQIHNEARLDTIRDRLLAAFDKVEEAAE